MADTFSMGDVESRDGSNSICSRDGSNSIDRISVLPKDMLERILYFLTQEESVRTSVLSKSWRYIWCTRPNLDFSYRTFKVKKQEFLSIVDKSLQRYCDQRLCVEEFRLCISLGDNFDQELALLLEKWIPTLTSMGVKKFCLSLPVEIQCVYFPPRVKLKLPSVVFGAESLQDLHLERFELDQTAIQRMVPFNRLKKLCLVGVSIEDEILQKIVSCSPLIETMCVKGCETLKTIKVNDLHNLKYFSFSDPTNKHCSIEFYAPSLETIKIYKWNLQFSQGADFRNLNNLSLCYVRSSLEHLSSCKFPNLRNLSLASCSGLKESHLFINAPNILYFEYAYAAEDFVPSISFATTSNEWKSCLYLRYWHPNDDSSSWFLKLNELLKSLSQSKISLTIN